MGAKIISSSLTWFRVLSASPTTPQDEDARWADDGVVYDNAKAHARRKEAEGWLSPVEKQPEGNPTCASSITLPLNVPTFHFPLINCAFGASDKRTPAWLPRCAAKKAAKAEWEAKKRELEAQEREAIAAAKRAPTKVSYASKNTMVDVSMLFSGFSHHLPHYPELMFSCAP